MYRYCKIESPVGLIIFYFNEKYVFKIHFDKQKGIISPSKNYTDPSNYPISKLVRAQIDEYFSLKRRCFRLPIRLEGTNFQKKVWAQVSKIAYGATASYTYIAQAIGKKNSVRAVANTIGNNPMSIVIPCHRVIGMNGMLTGYAGGLAIKSTLLQLESKDLD